MKPYQRPSKKLTTKEIATDIGLRTLINDKRADIPESKIEKALKSLSPREGKMLRMRYGIGYNNTHTLEEIGEEYKLSRERIRQIIIKAKQKLKNRTF